MIFESMIYESRVRMSENPTTFLSGRVMMQHPLKNKKKQREREGERREKERNKKETENKWEPVDCQNNNSLCRQKIYSIQFPYKYLFATFITFSCVEMLKRDALCLGSLFRRQKKNGKGEIEKDSEVISVGSPRYFLANI